ncbi:P-loop containing NTP hydrolase pore-1-domain-containing protein [Baffinella frigidus]|nr:P-loop containing NTP hydrolase pore-1-domain-containing protein [Cryptophyta sp. CCMP2293]
MFCTYALLVGEDRYEQLQAWLGDEFDGVLIFDEAHRCKNSLVWNKLGDDFDGVLIFDEAHRCKNSGTTKVKGGPQEDLAGGGRETAQRVIELQMDCPSARVFMRRLELWGDGTAFDDFSSFETAISKGGLQQMELVA